MCPILLKRNAFCAVRTVVTHIGARIMWTFSIIRKKSVSIILHPTVSTCFLGHCGQDYGQNRLPCKSEKQLWKKCFTTQIFEEACLHHDCSVLRMIYQVFLSEECKLPGRGFFKGNWRSRRRFLMRFGTWREEIFKLGPESTHVPLLPKEKWCVPNVVAVTRNEAVTIKTSRGVCYRVANHNIAGAAEQAQLNIAH